MSGGNCPETPRQKMIGMMYLFLTAMLAVNVSDEVLKAFNQVDVSLQSNNEIFTSNNAALYRAFETEVEENRAKYGEAWEIAIELREKANALYNQLDSTKWYIARKSDGEDGDPNNLKKKDDTEKASTVMLYSLDPKKPTRANLLKAQVDDYRNFILEKVIVDQEKFSSLAETINKSLDTSDRKRKDGDHSDDEGPKSWEASLFEGIPLAGVMPLLTKVQSDVRNTESMAIQHLFGQVGAADFSVNKFEARLILDSKYLVRGSVQNGMALLGAVDSTKRPNYEVYINNTPLEVSENGAFTYPTSASGKYEITGNIQLEGEDGEIKKYSFPPQTFEVGELSATVSATKMNVLYAGVENPMSISVPGISSNNITPRLSDGSPLKQVTNGSYIATPRTPGKEIEMIVNAMIEGSVQEVGRYPFRVKSLPPPTAFVQYPKEVKDASGNTITVAENFQSGRLKKLDLLKAYGIVAELLDSDFDVKYTVKSFEMIFYDTMGNAQTYKSNNSKFTNDQIRQIKGLTRGTQFFISNVRAVGPDGIEKRLPPIDITIN